ncbi:MAG: hypothetical protein Q8O89_08250 [Nanoarchaeota archaeon]|nr:hypothetical protein [Nanoarchaeota archaeon]
MENKQYSIPANAIYIGLGLTALSLIGNISSCSKNNKLKQENIVQSNTIIVQTDEIKTLDSMLLGTNIMMYAGASEESGTIKDANKFNALISELNCGKPINLKKGYRLSAQIHVINGYRESEDEKCKYGQIGNTNDFFKTMSINVNLPRKQATAYLARRNIAYK